MKYQRILVLLVLVVTSTVVVEDELGGAAFVDPGIFWRAVPPDWIHRPIAPAAEVQDADLFISLDQQLYPYLLPHIEAYAETHGLTIAAHGGTCGISAGLLRNKAVDIGGFCCPPGARDRLPGLRFHTLAIAAVALLVHPDNPVEDLTLTQARGLFSGEITHWSSVADSVDLRPAQAVHPIARLHCPVRPGHWRLLLDNEELFSADMTDVGAIEDMVRVVAADPQAIGYETLWMVRHHQAMGKVKPVRLNGVSPDDVEALAKGRYPLYRVYNVTTWEGVAGKPLAGELVRHLLDRTQEVDSRFSMASFTRLRELGWRFEGDELVGAPESNASRAAPPALAGRDPSPAIHPAP